MPIANTIDLVLYGGDLTQGHAGVAVYLHRLIEALGKEAGDLRWKVAVPDSLAGQLGFLPPENRLTVHGRDLRGFLLREISWHTRIARWVNAHSPDAVFHTPFHFWSPVCPRRTLATAHDCIEMRVPEVRQPGRVRRFHRSLCWGWVKRAQRVLTVSEWTRQDLLQFVGARSDRVFVLPNWPGPEFNGSRDEARLQTFRERYRLPRRYIAYLGGYRSYKNVPFLLRAWSQSSPEAQRTPLVLAGPIPAAGGGNYYTDIRAEAETARHAGREVILPGPIAAEDLPDFYRAATLFVSPSRFEGFGYPPVEATACGTPVLVADSSAYREVFPEERLRFTLDSSEGLAHRLDQALRDPAAFRATLSSRYTAAAGAREYLQHIQALLSR